MNEEFDSLLYSYLDWWLKDAFSRHSTLVLQVLAPKNGAEVGHPVHL